MTDEKKPIPPSEWRTIVENVPIASVDLVIEHDGGVLWVNAKTSPPKESGSCPAEQC